MGLDIESEKRGAWHVVTRPAGARVTNYPLPNRKAAQVARDVISDGVPGFPWDADRAGLKAAATTWREEYGVSLKEAVTRVLAAVPAADPHGWCADSVRTMDTVRAEQAAYAAREEAGGYTETVKPEDVRIGDEISFRYAALGSRGIFGVAGFRGLALGPREARTVTVRGAVAGEGLVMNRHGNNHDEFMDGLRFPLKNAVWLADDGSTGPLETSVTVEWSARLRRRPRTA
jgi:hypothetical protein